MRDDRFIEYHGMMVCRVCDQLEGECKCPTALRIRPLGNRVLLRKIEVSSRGGIVQPRGIEGDEGTQEYEVLHGADLKDKSDGVSAGARVYLAKHKGWKLERDGEEELYVADVEDVLAVEESA